MSISKEQQAQLTEHLKDFICSARFELDGHQIEVQKQRSGENALILVVFIDGQLEGKNVGMIEDVELEVAKKVYRHRTKACYTRKFIKDVEKAWGKRRAKKEWPRLHDKHIWLDPSFNTAASLVRQFAKLDSIRLVELGGEPV
ncbi:hypothetical protein ACH42_08445 [Endozoicomonas sp. (ex Bugula neritina AB1)]|nr:hypothetical protein ACH42_08445 [Endozoicomonas sp. (ex Bugula neritina AB1)]